MASMHRTVDERLSPVVGQPTRYGKQRSTDHGRVAGDQCARAATPCRETDVLALLRNAPALGRCVLAVSNGPIASTVAGRVVRVVHDGDDVVLGGSLFETRVSLAACASSHVFADPVTGGPFLRLRDQDRQCLLQIGPLSMGGSLVLRRYVGTLADEATSGGTREPRALRGRFDAEHSLCAMQEAIGAISSLSLALPLAIGVCRVGAQQVFRGSLTRVGGTAPLMIVSGTCCSLHVDCRAIHSMDLQVSQEGRSRSERIVLRDSQSASLGWIEPLGNPDAWEIFIGLAGCRRMANAAGVLQTRSSKQNRQRSADQLDTRSRTGQPRA